MTDQPSIADLSRQVAEAKSCRSQDCRLNLKECPGYAHVPFWHNRKDSGGYGMPGTSHWHIGKYLGFADPARLWELEGELQQLGWDFGYDNISADWWASPPGNFPYGPNLTEPGTPEGRVRLVLRAWLEMSGGKIV